MKLHIGVLFGGKSTEHEISVISGIQAMNNIDKNKYEIIPIYISKDEKFYIGDYLRKLKNYKDLSEIIKNATECYFTKADMSKVNIMKSTSPIFARKLDYIDVFFPVLHGGKGENGSIQGLLEMLDIPFVGSGVLASAMSMDKDISKLIAMSMGIPVIAFEAVNRYDYNRNPKKFLSSILQKFDFPMIIKPCGGGSSIGIKVAKSIDDIRESFEYVFQYDAKVIVENKMEKLREMNCSVIGDAIETKTSEVEEVIRSNEIFSFQDKYQHDQGKWGSSNNRLIPANIDEELKNIIQKYSRRLFRKFDCSGVVRFDYLIDQDSGTLYFGEINPIPGSMAYYFWEASGITYKELVDELIKIGIRCHQRKGDFNYNYENDLFLK